MKELTIWNEERKIWEDTEFDDIITCAANDKQYQMVCTNNLYQLYYGGSPVITDKWFKEIEVVDKSFSNIPLGLNLFEVTDTLNQKGLYISTYIKATAITPIDSDIIYAGRAIGVFSKKTGAGAYSYSGQLIVPKEYDRIYFEKKIIISEFCKTKPIQRKHEIFQSLFGIMSGHYDSLFGAYTYDGKHILDDIYVKLELSYDSIKAWTDFENYKMFSYEGKEIQES